jgi:hypothetical protein
MLLAHKCRHVKTFSYMLFSQHAVTALQLEAQSVKIYDFLQRELTLLVQPKILRTYIVGILAIFINTF